ncbi:MAG TPA: ATP phosphoribosyltransferase [Candidatus Coprenecus stercoravium]|uniref:ATP phosphoribosyltransferase n=1 Tax=Candidatus Coprenecus stercoravium TaxID=2840735 RepID=A0A9D2GQU1_9BACT|nr:ATP phosphoribosyltransferase [Candidatus Coprenecus stercoravium]HIZ87118.1 ATP phosphoribosyltransferase [Candidatus Coprenecus pullistercoris]
MLRIALQSKGRLNEKSLALLRDAGIGIDENNRRLLSQASNFPVELLYLRDDDIPKTVSCGIADIGIVGLNEVMERKFDVDILQHLGFGKCRLSLAIPKNLDYTGPQFFEGRKIATSYPRILKKYFMEKGVDCEIREIAGSVEISPAIGLADGIFDIVSSGSTLIQNGLKEVEKVMDSDAVLIGVPGLDEEKKGVVNILMSRFTSIIRSRGKKYMLVNISNEKIEDALAIIPAMKSPTLLPLADKGWSAIHSVVEESEVWDKVDRLKKIGAEDILVLSMEKLIL